MFFFIFVFFVLFLMVVHNLNPFCVIPNPLETNPPLIVDPDAVLDFPSASQGFQPIARRTSKIAQGSRFVKILQLSSGHLLHILSQHQGALPLKDFLRLPAGKATYHYTIISP
jgi:hypothetical protein